MDDATRVRRKDTTKGPPLRILSLDGGGVRGFSIFIVLEELMHRTFVEIQGRAPRPNEIPKPCDHFDLIGGNGTGGLIAIMLGRLRLDIETCKEVYVRMTRRVFQTDKTFAGIPYKRTLFKASKLEEAIRECVREHTVFEDEGNDVLSNAVPMTSDIPTRPTGVAGSDGAPQRSFSQSSRYSQMSFSPATPRSSVGLGSARWGNPNALLYDTRENRTKTAVTAVFKGARDAESTVMLRSYDSRKEPAPEVNCTIWQAGRATAATGLAFKPIQIGQYVYHDDGSGKYNPSPTILDEAAQNEWPGRDVGIFVSIGTGRRPSGTNNNQQEWYENFLGGTMGDFAEARRRLISRIEGCEDTHRFMLREHLAARGVNPENYYRFNVEVGVGEFGLNEWNRLSDISTNTRMYLSKHDVQGMNVSAATKLAKIVLAKVRQSRADAHRRIDGTSTQGGAQNPWDRPQSSVPPPSNPIAVELPGDEAYAGSRPPWGGLEHKPSFADQKFIVLAGDEHHQHSPPQRPAKPAAASYQQHQPTTSSNMYAPQQSLNVSPIDASPRVSHESTHRPTAPPLPPKTPLPYPDEQAPFTPPGGPTTFMNLGDLGRRLPYPDMEAPPPAVNTSNKPQINR